MGSQYDAFVSYRRSDGSAAATWLRRQLRGFRLPRELRPGRRKQLRIYLDRIYERPDEDFWQDTIVPALQSARSLVVVATPDSLKPGPDNHQSWIEREIEVFMGSHHDAEIIVVIAGLQHTDPLPGRLREHFPNIATIDIGPATTIFGKLRRANDLRESVRTIAAALFEVPAESMPILRREDQRRRNRLRLAVAGAAAPFAFAIGYLYLQNEVSSALALERQRVADANKLVVRAEQFVDSDPTKAIAIALASTREVQIPSARTTIARAIQKLPASQILRVEERPPASPTVVFPENLYGLSDLFFAHHGSLLVAHHLEGFAHEATTQPDGTFGGIATTLGSGGNVTIWDVASGHRTSRLDGIDGGAAKVAVCHRHPTTLCVLSNSGGFSRHQVRANGSTILVDEAQGSFVGMAIDARSALTVAWNRDGDVFEIPRENPIRSIWPGEAYLDAAVDAERQILVAITEQPEGVLLDLQTGEVRWRTRPQIDLDRGGFNSSWKAPTVSVGIMNSLPVAVFLSENDGGVRVNVVLTDTGESLFSVERQFASASVDWAGGKFALLSGSRVEQWHLRADGEQLAISDAEAWNLTSSDEDVGRGQALHYGPFGEYLLSSNAPILTLVGSKPGLVKLWYANGFTDSRAGDAHHGVQLGTRNFPVLNLVLARDGHRLALFTTDGNVRVFDVFDEQAISPNTRAQSFFSGHHHLPLATRSLLQREPADLAGFLAAIEMLFRVRLNEDEYSQITRALRSGGSLEEVLPLSEEVPSTIALQSREERDELPNLALGLLGGTRPDLSNYRPIASNANLRELVDDLLERPGMDEEEIASRYLVAARNDVLLLVGVQIEQLLADLASPESLRRRRAWIALGLSGDASLTADLQEARDAESETDVQRSADWALRFLQQTGEDLSVPGARAFVDEWDTRRGIVNFPNRRREESRLQRVVAVPWSADAWRAIIHLATSADRRKSFPLVAQLSRIAGELGLAGPTALQTDLNLAVYLRDQGLLQEASSISTMLLGRVGEEGRVRGKPENLHGFILTKLGRPEEALVFFQAAIDAGRPDGWPERNMGATLANLGRDDEARAYFRRAIEQAERPLVVAREKLAEDEYQEFAEKVEPEVAGFYNEFAWHLVTSNINDREREDARSLAIKANELTDFKNPNFLDTLAHVQASFENWARAIELEERALALIGEEDPDRATFEATLHQWREMSDETSP